MRAAIAAGLAFLVLAGCAQATGHAKQLPHATLTIDTAKGPVRFDVEVAADPASQALGLMYRTEMAPNAGMLFDFHQPVTTAFWMKNTVIPLDIIFIRPNGTISTIHADAVPYSTEPIPSAEPVQAVLEINGGRARALGIEPGARVHEKIFDGR
jgi:hypothetical protein